MKKAIIKEALPLFTHEENDVKQIPMGKEDYLFRIGLLREKMKEEKIDVALIFGDREHFSNIEYFSGYDCRFEEGMLSSPPRAPPLCWSATRAWATAWPFPMKSTVYSTATSACRASPAGSRKNWMKS